jgi:hypothetical protein
VLALGPAEIEAIDAFVRAGGGLVVTGPVAVRDQRSREWASSALAGLLGVDFGAPGPASYPYLRLTDAELSAQLGGRPFPHYGSMTGLVAIQPDVRVLARRTDPVLETDKITYWHNNQPAPGVATDLPLIVERTVGAGRVIVSAARLGNNHARLGHGTYRDLLGALVRRAAGGDPPVTVLGGHRATELVLAHRGSELIVHLVTGSPVARLDVAGAQQPAAIEDIANLASVRLGLPAETTAVLRVVDGRPVPVELSPTGNGPQVELRDLDDWETLVVLRDGRR